MIVGILTAPISALAPAVLYFDLRKAHGDSGRSRSRIPLVPVRPVPARGTLSAIDASKLLRPGVLEGVSVLLAVPPGAIPEGMLWAAVSDVCAALGARCPVAGPRPPRRPRSVQP